jgi:hypothetical protein
MPVKMTITVIFDDESDFDFHQTRLLGTVEDYIAEKEEDETFEGRVALHWDYE